MPLLMIVSLWHFPLHASFLGYLSFHTLLSLLILLLVEYNIISPTIIVLYYNLIGKKSD